MRLKENKVYFKAGVTAFLVIAAGILCWFLIDRMDQVSGAFNKVMAILRPFIIGGALAYLLAPACNALDRVFLGWTRGRADRPGEAVREAGADYAPGDYRGGERGADADRDSGTAAADAG